MQRDRATFFPESAFGGQIYRNRLDIHRQVLYNVFSQLKKRFPEFIRAGRKESPVLNKRIAALILSFCLALAVVPLFASPASAIGEVMKAERGTPWIDGEIDAIWKRANRQKLTHRTRGEGTRENSLCHVSVLWDDEALYFLFELTDNDFTFEAEPGSPLNDCVYLYIDEKDVFGTTWKPGQTRICLTPAPGLSLYPMDGDAPADFEMAYAMDIDGHWNIEFKYVPHTLNLAKVERILMDFQYCDANPDGFVESIVNWSDEQGECETDSASWTYVTMKRTASGTSGEGFATVEEAAASINRTPVYPLRFISGTNGNHNEGAANIWDGNVGTKFCTSEFSMKSVVRMKGPTVLDGLIMATANDNSAYNGRNPDEWKIQGSNNSQDWEDIVTGDESFFDEVDFTYFAMRVESDKAYRFFRFYNRSCKSGCCQISEVVLCSTDQSVKDLDNVTEEVEHVDKETLVQYENPARLAARAPVSAEEAVKPVENVSVAEEKKVRSTSVLPGVITVSVILVGLGVLAVLAPKFRKED